MLCTDEMNMFNLKALVLIPLPKILQTTILIKCMIYVTYFRTQVWNLNCICKHCLNKLMETSYEVPSAHSSWSLLLHAHSQTRTQATGESLVYVSCSSCFDTYCDNETSDCTFNNYVRTYVNNYISKSVSDYVSNTSTNVPILSTKPQQRC